MNIEHRLHIFKQSVFLKKSL